MMVAAGAILGDTNLVSSLMTFDGAGKDTRDMFLVSSPMTFDGRRGVLLEGRGAVPVSSPMTLDQSTRAKDLWATA